MKGLPAAGLCDEQPARETHVGADFVGMHRYTDVQCRPNFSRIV